MENTCETYLTDQHFYDFRLFSTLGFSEEDVEAFSTLEDVNTAEGGKSIDVMMEYSDSIHALKLLAIPETVNRPSLTEGRLSASEEECLADAKAFGMDAIGTTIRISEENSEDTVEQLSCTEFTIVGLCDSSLYLNDDRGTTTIGSGALDGFLYIPEAVFTDDVYTEISLELSKTVSIYSDEYDDLIESHEAEISDLLKQLSDDRYTDLLAEYGLTLEYAAQMGISEAEIYLLTRNENAGYISFENDTSIISGVANIFPVFFILIALLVCITTMTRMVDEERTQMGVLKAMGFGNAAITAKYLLYAGSATLIGWAAGFFLGTWVLPQIFWFAYSSFYNFAPLSYLFSPYLALLTLAVSLLGILGSALLSCWKEFGSQPAKLIRPKAAKNGKRILLERIASLWSHLPFLQKITLRNMFRYKRRLIMMLAGISCCAGLVVTAFGVRDSMINIGALQYEEIQKYDIEAAFSEGGEETVRISLEELQEIEDSLACSVLRVNLHGTENMNSVNLYSFRELEQFDAFWCLQSEDSPEEFPKTGEAVLPAKQAMMNKLKAIDMGGA